MSSLLKLREWLTVSEAASYMSRVCVEEVSEADILRLSLEGRLTLSVHFVNCAYANPGRLLSMRDALYFEATGLDGKPVKFFRGTPIDEDKFLELESKIVEISGVWDLTMWGSEELDVEQRFQMITGGPAVTMENLEGPLLRVGAVIARVVDNLKDNEFYDGALKEPYTHPANWYPAATLPQDSVLVVRMRSLEELLVRSREVEETVSAEPAGEAMPARTSGGRPMSRLWPNWVAELAALLHHEGIPSGVGADGMDELIATIADRLASRGVDAPSRSTVQQTARAVLLRLRAGK